MKEGIEPNTVYRKSADQTSANIGDDEVVLQMVDGVYYSLNSTGREVWQQLDQPQSLDSLANHLTEKYDVDRIACLEAVHDLLEQMESAGLVSRQKPE